MATTGPRGSALGLFAGGIIADRFGRHEIVVATGLLTAALVSLALGLLAVPVAALLLCVVVGGFAWGCTTPSRDLLVRSAAPAGAVGTVVGFVYSGLDLGSAMTAPFLGFLLDHHHPRCIFHLLPQGCCSRSAPLSRSAATIRRVRALLLLLGIYG